MQKMPFGENMDKSKRADNDKKMKKKTLKMKLKKKKTTPKLSLPDNFSQYWPFSAKRRK